MSQRGPLPLGPHGRFELLELLGRGGMGAVYRARDLDLGREVALKVVLRPGHEVQRERFLREGQIAAGLDHPGIVKVHDAGYLGELPYLACELVQGAETLEVAARRLSREQQLDLVGQAARALGYAHAAGVVHRDVKPSNLLVDGAGRLRVADFGLAARGDMARLTRTGAIVGTPGYMAPEMITGRREELGPPADVWALGVILFELLSGGTSPFESTDLASLAVQITSSPHEDLRALAPGLPAGLAAIVDRCLEKEPARRYPDGEALALDLERFQGGTRPLAGARSRRLPLVTAAGLVALGLALAAWLVFNRPPRPEDASPSPPPSRSAAKPSPSPAASLDPAAGQRAWREVRNLDPRRRVLAAEAWLETYPGHPERPQVEAFLEREAALRPARILTHASGPLIVRAAFTADGRLLSYGGDGRLLTWSLGQEAPLAERQLPSKGDDLTHLLVLPNGDVLAGSPQAPLTWIRGERGVTFQDVSPCALACSADGSLVAVGLVHKGLILLFDVASQHAPDPYGEGKQDYQALCFDAGTHRLAASRGATTGYNRVAEDALDVFDLRSGRELSSKKTEGLIRVIRRLPGSEQVLVGFNTGRLEAWDLDGPGRQRAFKGPETPGNPLLSARAVPGSMRELALDPQRQLVYVTCSGDGGDFNQIVAWDLERGKPLRAPIVRPPYVAGCSLSPDGRFLAVGTGRGVVEVWSTRGLR